MKLRASLKDRWHFVLEKAARAHSILHVGCTTAPNTQRRWASGTMLHKALCDQASASGQNVVGLDIDESALQWLSSRMPGARLICGDAHRIADHVPGERFDLIVAGDVIEHLSNPGLFLDSCHAVLTDNGSIVLSTINAFGCIRFLKAVLGHEAVHGEHTAYYSMSTMKRLSELSRFELNEVRYCLFESHLWRTGLNGLLSAGIERVVCSLWPQFAEGLVVVLKKSKMPKAT
jgi:2-polyprenyl-3-methyl-5-hydroxy-6-metoxy-1,4-benzoquinol methylase